MQLPYYFIIKSNKGCLKQFSLEMLKQPYAFIVFIVFIVWISNDLASASKPCILRQTGLEGKVCVCNASYCDTFDRIHKIRDGTFIKFTSDKSGQRFNKMTGHFSFVADSPALNFSLDPCSKGLQTIFGFGGAFTDATGINIRSLSRRAQDQLLRSYFSPEGIEYEFGRVPIGGTDFSTHGYSLDDNGGEPDPLLANFSLAEEDYLYKIPMIRRAQAMSDHGIQLICASWSPPPWMKTNNDYKGQGSLIKEYYELYAEYLLRFLKAYKEYGIEFWAISTQNEPSDGNFPLGEVLPFAVGSSINCLGWTPDTLGEWVQNYFGPMVRRSCFSNVLIFSLDDQRAAAPLIDEGVAKHPNVLEYIDGWAFHWYTDEITSVEVVDSVHDKYPEIPILYTESSSGYSPVTTETGNWNSGQDYLASIIENLNHWSTGWIDWNMCLSEERGPMWTSLPFDSPIIVNATADEFYKQPMYYAMAHASKFVRRGAVRLLVEGWDRDGVQILALRNLNGRIVIIGLNKNSEDKPVSIYIRNQGYINVKFEKYSFHTIIFCE